MLPCLKVRRDCILGCGLAPGHGRMALRQPSNDAAHRGSLGWLRPGQPWCTTACSDPGVALIGKPFTIEELAAKVRTMLDALVTTTEQG